MKIVVCAKHVPDPNMPMEVDTGTKRLKRNPAQSILDPSDEFGIEIALQIVEKDGGEVVVLTMGPAAAEDALRRAMAMGAGRAIHIIDDALAGSDALGTAKALAAAIKAEEPDMVICAVESTDAYTGMVPGALAELLDLPQVTFARSLAVDGGAVSIQRATESGYQTVQAQLPALVTVTASVAEPRYPSFKLMMQAKKKPVDARDTGALGVDAGAVGESGAKEEVLTVELIREEKQGVKITDEGGDSVDQIVAYLKKIQVA
ncbi:MAG: electron transfer flavoprotein subunit beta/FixA family protein [Thermomicrobiales bacterium]|nr:electron transfer flavoprotein subunit beta/FixA family protein [Thermomicrobiales bacterium]